MKLENIIYVLLALIVCMVILSIDTGRRFKRAKSELKQAKTEIRQLRAELTEAVNKSQENSDKLQTEINEGNRNFQRSIDQLRYDDPSHVELVERINRAIYTRYPFD